MLNVIKTCVKYVHTTQGKLWKNFAKQSTVDVDTDDTLYAFVNNPYINHILLTFLPTTLSTVKNQNPNLLNNFFTHNPHSLLLHLLFLKNKKGIIIWN